MYSFTLAEQVQSKMQKCTIDLKIACEKIRPDFGQKNGFLNPCHQDWFTNLGFRHPELFHVLSCRCTVYILTLKDSPVTSKVLLNSVVVLHTNLIGPGSTDRQVFNF